MSLGVPLILLVLLLAALPPLGNTSDYFSLIEGYLCIRSEFIETAPEAGSVTACAIRCHFSPRCRAFSLADGPCQLFVFDKCSKSVRDCSCSRRGRVFVKQRFGLEPGALCPSGYGDDLCGVKYKLLSEADFWWPSRQKCESESGLVIMADVMDATEMSHVETIYSKYSAGSTMWLGGHQSAGSTEKRGGWYWASCNITLDDSLWNEVEPNDSGSQGENVIGRFVHWNKLSDFWESVDRYRVLCECVSPFV